MATKQSTAKRKSSKTAKKKSRKRKATPPPRGPEVPDDLASHLQGLSDYGKARQFLHFQNILAERRETFPFLYFEPNKGMQEDVMTCDAMERWVFAGNQIGKTAFACAETDMHLSGRYPDRIPESCRFKPPVYARIASVDYPNGIEQIILPELQRWLPWTKKAGVKYWHSKSRLLTFANGSTLDFKSYEQPLNAFAGVKRHFIWFDEHCPNMSKYTESLFRLAALKGRFLCTMTPTLGMTWEYSNVFLKAHEKNPKQFRIFGGSTYENSQNLDPEVLARLESECLTEEDKARRLHGLFVSMTGLMYPAFKAETHKCKPFEIPADWRRILVIDHGFAGRCGALWAAVRPDGRIYVYREHYEKGKTIEQNIQLMVDRTGAERIDLCLADPQVFKQYGTKGRRLFFEYNDAFKKFGSSIRLAQANNDPDYGYAMVRQYLAGDEQLSPKIKFFDTLQWLFWEISNYVHEAYREEHVDPKERAKKQNDHLMDCLRYLCIRRPAPRRVDNPKVAVYIPGDPRTGF